VHLTLEELINHEIAYFAFVAAVERTPIAWFLNGPTLPEYHDANRALHLRDDGRGAEAVTQEVIAYFRSRGLPVVADLDAMAEAQGIGFALRRRGITPVMGDRVLLRYAHTTPPVLRPSSVEVQTVPNAPESEALATWIDLSVSDSANEPDAALWRAVAEQEARFPLCRLYLGLLEGRPAGACDLFSAEGWGRIEMVATHPAMRRRGVASAVVTHALTDSLAEGNQVTYLFTESNSEAERLYIHLGFERWGMNVLWRHLER